MRLSRLNLSNFRLFRKVDIEFENPITLFTGANAQGKSSILEAIFMFVTYTSPQTANIRHLMNFSSFDESQPVSRLVAHFMKDDIKHVMEIRLIAESSDRNISKLRKEILVDGVKKTVSHAIGGFNAVIFLPQMTALLERGPDERRRFLDQMIAQTEPLYARALIDYNNALVRRNALLKRLNETGGDKLQLDHWDNLLAENGATILEIRSKTIKSLEIISARKLNQLSGNLETLQTLYKPGFEQQRQNDNFKDISRIQLNKQLSEQLLKNRKTDIARGITTVGPHRDEVRFFINNIDVGDYGSRGQIRSTVLALKFAEMEFIQDKTGEWPILLLDETIAELDQERRNNLFAVIDQSQQVILTTSDLDMFPTSFLKKCEIKFISDGMISNQS